ncbi:MAG: phosphoribosylformylglycinamidine synthase I [Candidatus Omnitrophica bacterium CG11_big_fil_rev_8_21_14_0_20_45_26]|uniref:Phosphoribosylformylglycinamidine synthase subunit PurQ n=1 Tax=Candidatus Abzuiibacterium crystallinum TaxID=1974748 RepID=A0A2H0LP92_9BACT|nr:MAG: phosphoribosylformylglycinamidine synthase I [Candidatus Omnitrophica bacterium CG11_big_fil_rev_8_21_14_0_20_45_26]PIW65254.1 MAG: phosphoribosylformylglycinamidine synthase I [Candidatus Omnitrophica bacterium CG12_big_fil_rev_8_21_14_0_65_45_16]
MKACVVVFPGSNCDHDCWHVMHDVMRLPVEYVWHKQNALPKVDLVILPGGFSYGDYLRTGAIARFSPIMQDVVRHANSGRAVIGICNGFQILLESGLLPGAMLRNDSLRFICKHIYLKAVNRSSIFTKNIAANQVLNIPIAHGEGNYFCDADTLKCLEQEDRIAFQYVSESGQVNMDANPNGSAANIAGILNEKKNVLGMMPHPERASEAILNSKDGRVIWESLAAALN